VTPHAPSPPRIEAILSEALLLAHREDVSEDRQRDHGQPLRLVYVHTAVLGLPAVVLGGVDAVPATIVRDALAGLAFLQLLVNGESGSVVANFNGSGLPERSTTIPRC